MLYISHYVGQILDAFSLCVFFLLFFKLSVNIRSKRNYLIAIISVLIINTIDSFYNNASIPLLILTCLLFIKDTNDKFQLINNFTVSLLFTLLSTRVAFLINTIVFNQRSGILHANWILFIAIFIIVFLIAILILFFIYKKLTVLISNSKLDPKFTRIVVFYNTSLILIILIISILTMRALQIETSFLPITLFILGILLFVTGITTTVVFSRRIQQLKEEHQQKIEKDTKQYIQMLETSYENLKRSKHDFKNTLLSLEYLSQKNNYDKVYDAINEILDSQLLTTRSNEHKFDLNQIKDEFMHSIVAQKVDEAESKKITVSLEFGSTIPVLKTNRAEIVRITGILLDNAIDAANQSSKRNITIAIVNTDDNIELSIRNTVADNVKINLTKIFVSGYSTKDSSRGIGLATVRELVDQLNSKVLFNVSYDEQVNEFTATLILINNEK